MKHRSPGIYSITYLINGKRYIGQSKNVHVRLLQHKSDLTNGRHHNKHLQSTFDISVAENFEYSLLEACDIVDLDEREVYWIAHFNSGNKGFGYNTEWGGRERESISGVPRKKYVLTEEHKKKISIGNIGKKHTEESKKKMSESSKGLNTWSKGQRLTKEWKEKIRQWNTGKIVSDETRLKISEANKGKPAYNKGIPLSEESKRKMSETKTLKATPEMLADINSGISRNKFASKYGHVGIWVRVRKEIKSN